MLSQARAALRSLARTVDKTVLGGLCLAAALFWAAGPRASFAARTATLNLAVTPNGVASIVDLTASSGPAVGQVTLSWTEPQRRSTTLPESYDIRVSSLAQIGNTGQFLAAQPLSAFSPSAIPAVGPAGALAGMVVAGLEPGVTYYFAIRAQDSSAPQYAGVWNRIPARGFNVDNSAPAGFAAGGPSAVADLAAAPTGAPGQARLTWTAPPTSVKLASFTVVYATRSVVDLAGDTAAWLNLSFATRTTYGTSDSSGTAESLLVSNLPSGTTVFFAVLSRDARGQLSPIDANAAGGATQAQVNVQNTIRLSVSSGTASGSLALSWTELYTTAFTPPVRYEIKASTTSNIEDDVGISTAPPLSAFSGVSVPAPGSGGATVTLPVTGLIPGVTYYFAIREIDSSTPSVVTHWIRDVSRNLNKDNFGPATFVANRPDAVADLFASTGAAEGHVALTWTAPANRNFVPMASYEVRFGTFSAASLGGDATAWFDLSASSAVVIPAVATGTPVALDIGGLYPLATWYFEVRSTDQRGEVSAVDLKATTGNQAHAMPFNEAPGTPSGLAAVAGLRRASLSWLDLTAAEKGLDFAFYRLYRSTQASAGFVQVTTTTAVAFVDSPLTAGTTYFYKLAASEGPGGLDGVASSTVAVTPVTLAPQEPFGFVTGSSSSSVTIQWTPTTRFGDGSPFVSTAAPAVDELQGYRIYRSTDICSPSFSQIASLGVSSNAFTDNTLGGDYFYQVRSFNSFAASTATLTISTLGDQHFFLDDCVSEVVLTREQAQVLSKSSNTLGGDILVERRRRGEDTGDGVMQSVEFRPMLNGVTELKNFYLPAPARVVLHYLVDGSGAPVPQDVSGAAKPRAAGAAAAAADPKNLGLFWNNGAGFKKLYGRVDPLSQTVEVQSPNLGVYQVRSQLRSDGVVFDVSNVSAKVITPNDDGLNDVFIVSYDPGPQAVVPTGAIYDLRGAFVANMVPGLVPNTLTWDGKMSGRAVQSGVYVYQIKGGGKTFNGTVVVAR